MKRNITRDLDNYILKSDTDNNITYEFYEKQIELLKNIYKGMR